MFSSCRSKTIIHDAFYFRGASDAVTMPSRRMLRDHQAGLPGDKAGSPRRIRHRVPERGSYYQFRNAAVYTDGAETVDSAI